MKATEREFYVWDLLSCGENDFSHAAVYDTVAWGNAAMRPGLPVKRKMTPTRMNGDGQGYYCYPGGLYHFSGDPKPGVGGNEIRYTIQGEDDTQDICVGVEG